jgi:hypothetical protein
LKRRLGMKYKYALSLYDKHGLKRICELLSKYAEIMEILNEDSKKSSEGGASMGYEIKIEIEEKWR